MRGYELRRSGGLLLALAGLLLLSACALMEDGEETPPQGAYKVYYAVTGEQSRVRAVDWEYRVPSGEDVAAELAELVLTQPEDPGLTSPAPAGTRLLSCQREEGQLRLDFSEQYGGLSGVELSVADCCIALTMCQMEGVESVYVTVEGAEIPYRRLQEITPEDVLLSGAEEEPVYIQAELWYPRAVWDTLGVECRQVLKTEEITTPHAVLAAWLEGPRQEDLVSCMPDGAEIYTAQVEDDVCYVDLSASFWDNRPADDRQAKLVLYALVNTLCALEGVDGVQLQREGERAEDYAGVDVSVPLKADTAG